MTYLVACLGGEASTWTNVLQLCTQKEFSQSFLIVNETTKRNLNISKPNIHIIVVNANTPTVAIRDSIVAQLKGKINDLEVALNIDSGSGKEHTALITALMRLGLSFRLVVFENNKVEEVTYDLEVLSEWIK